MIHDIRRRPVQTGSHREKPYQKHYFKGHIKQFHITDIQLLPKWEQKRRQDHNDPQCFQCIPIIGSVLYFRGIILFNPRIFLHKRILIFLAHAIDDRHVLGGSNAGYILLIFCLLRIREESCLQRILVFRLKLSPVHLDPRQFTARRECIFRPECIPCFRLVRFCQPPVRCAFCICCVSCIRCISRFFRISRFSCFLCISFFGLCIISGLQRRSFLTFRVIVLHGKRISLRIEQADIQIFPGQFKVSLAEFFQHFCGIRITGVLIIYKIISLREILSEAAFPKRIDKGSLVCRRHRFDRPADPVILRHHDHGTDAK